MTEITKIELEQLAELKNRGADSSTSDTSRIYYYKHRRRFGFVNVSGDALTEATSVTFWYYRTPKTDGTEDISDSVEPIIDQRWDDCLVAWACYSLTGDPKWLQMYQLELRRMSVLEGAQTDRVYSIPSNRDYD